MWPPNIFKTNLCSILIRQPGGLRKQLESPHNRLVYRFLRNFADLAVPDLAIQRFRELVEKAIQVFVHLPLFLNLVDRMHDCCVVLAAKLPADFR